MDRKKHTLSKSGPCRLQFLGTALTGLIGQEARTHFLRSPWKISPRQRLSSLSSAQEGKEEDGNTVSGLQAATPHFYKAGEESGAHRER